MDKEELTLSFEINEENKKALDFLIEEAEKTHWYRIENEAGEHLDVVDKEKYDNLQQENKQLKEMIDEQDGCNKRRLQIFELKDKLCKEQKKVKELNEKIKYYENPTNYFKYASKQVVDKNKFLRCNWTKLKEHLWNLRNVAFTKEFGNEWNNCLSFNEDILPIINKMQELENGDSNE